MTNNEQTWSHFLMNNYGTPARTFIKGQGCWLEDQGGKKYLDLLAGIAVNALGYAHPNTVAAVNEQVQTLGHISNLFASEPVMDLAQALVERVGYDARVLFCNSGAEANEAAFKLARLTCKGRILAAEHGFHGRTMGALAMTGQPSKREPFAPLPAGVEFYPYGDAQALQAMMDDNVAAIILEPIQGETGVIPAPEGFLAEVRRLCDEYGALMIVDEVQTGTGRTGKFFAHQWDGVEPDIISMAKGLGGGLPLGACIARKEVADLFGPGSHGTTFGGNPIVCAAALSVLEVLSDEFLGKISTKGELFKQLLSQIPGVNYVRGRGLMLGVVLDQPKAKEIVKRALDHGLILNAPSESVIRITPPLIISEEEIRQAVEIFSTVIEGE